MRVLSWNLFGLSDDEVDVRTESAMFLALLGGAPEVVLTSGASPPPMPAILLLQEVTERTLHAHVRPHLRRAGYTVVPPEPRPREYFEVVALDASFTVLSHAVEALPSSMGREMVSVHATRDGLDWLVMTAHLESLKDGAPERVRQAEIVLQRLRAHDGPAVFGGDTNLRVAEAEALGSLPDAWEACGSRTAERWTRVSPRTGAKARYDRIWGLGMSFSGFRCIGRDPVTPKGAPPSDHLGVEVTVRPR